MAFEATGIREKAAGIFAKEFGDLKTNVVVVPQQDFAGVVRMWPKVLKIGL